MQLLKMDRSLYESHFYIPVDNIFLYILVRGYIKGYRQVYKRNINRSYKLAKHLLFTKTSGHLLAN